MAKTAFILLLSLFSSLTLLSHARNPIPLPEYSNWKSISTEPNSLDEEPTLLLPSEKQTTEETLTESPFKVSAEESPVIGEFRETNTLPESDAKLISEDGSLPESGTISAVVVTEPLRAVDGDFRPVVHFHHMRVRRPFWFRFPRRCHGHRHHHHHRDGGFRREIPYGNDMIQFPARNVEIEADLTRFPMNRGDVDGVRHEFKTETEKYNGRFDDVEERVEFKAGTEKYNGRFDDVEERVEKKGGFLRWIKKLMD